MIECIDGQTVKFCPKCSKHRPVQEFSIVNEPPPKGDGLCGCCKTCQKLAMIESRVRKQQVQERQERQAAKAKTQMSYEQRCACYPGYRETAERFARVLELALGTGSEL